MAERDSASQVLSGLLSCGVILIDELSRKLSEPHFQDPNLRTIYRAILAYRSIAGGVLTVEAIEQMTEGADAGTAAHVRETYDALVSQPVSLDATRWAVQQLRLERERWLTANALRDAQEIMAGSVQEEPDRLGMPGRVWSGPADAREWMLLRTAEIASETAVSDAPAADVFLEGADILADYIRARDEDDTRRPKFGIPALDELTGGMGKGQLIIVAASSGFGKSQACTSFAYHAAVEQGLHVYFATSETVRVTVRSRLLARHSRHPKFSAAREILNLPYGLDSKKINRGTLDRSHEPFLGAVVKDFGLMPQAGDAGGSLWVAQMPHGESVAAMAAQIDIRARAAKPDLIVVDYLALMSGSTRRFASKREELSSIIIDAAHFVVDYNKGEGVPLVSPWQLNRESQKEMVRTGQLDSSGLAETAEIVNSSDLVLSLSPDGTREGRHAGIRLGVLKNRDGETLLGEDGIAMRVDYASSYFEERPDAPGGLDGDAFDIGSNGALTDGAAASLLGNL